MRREAENNSVIVFPEGRIDSSNAAEVQKEWSDILEENPGLTLIVDAGELTYISSAGLRVLLYLTKKQGSPVSVRNVSPEVYEILEVTGFVNLLKVTKKLREISVDGCEIVGSGAIGTVYRIDEDTIVKVYQIPDSIPMIENEQRRAKQAFFKGIPTAISYDVVKVGDKYGSVFEMLKATTFNEELIRHPENRAAIVSQYTRLIRQIHAVEMERGELPEAKDVFLRYLDGLRPLLRDGLYERLYGLFTAMPENLHVVHGDIQMKNVMLSGDEPLMIDMDTLSVGDPVFDLMCLYVTYVLYLEDEPGNSMDFLGLTPEMCQYIWEKTLACYFEDRDAKTLPGLVKKIQLVACVRFLFLVAKLHIGRPEYEQLRIDRALRLLGQLAEEVDSLAIGSEMK